MRKIFLLVFTSILLVAFGHAAWGRSPNGYAVATFVASQQGLQNSNGIISADRDKGVERAEDRISRKDLTHEKVTATKHKKRRQQQPFLQGGGNT